RPGLAVWHTGAGATDVRVAVAWPEGDAGKPGRLRLWDASAANRLQGWDGDLFLQTAALLGQDGGASVLTGGFGGGSGRLGVWSVSADREASGSFEARATFPPRDRVHYLPVALAVVPGRDGVPGHAAVVLQPSASADFRLALVDLRANRVISDFPLEGSD